MRRPMGPSVHLAPAASRPHCGQQPRRPLPPPARAYRSALIGAVLATLGGGCTLTEKVDEVVPSEAQEPNEPGESNESNLEFSKFWNQLAALQCGYVQRCLDDAYLESE